MGVIKGDTRSLDYGSYNDNAWSQRAGYVFALKMFSLFLHALKRIPVLETSTLFLYTLALGPLRCLHVVERDSDRTPMM